MKKLINAIKNYSGKYKGQRIVSRIIAMVVAVVVMGIGCSMFIYGGLGSDPFSTINIGVSYKVGVSFGTWQAIFNCLLLIFVVAVDRSMLGLGTIGNMFLVGFTADIMKMIYDNILPPTEEVSFWVRLLFVLGGVAFQIVGCSFYVTSNMGMAPYDCISYILPNLTKLPFHITRIAIDFICVGVGFACGAAVGLGTLIMAFGTGPLLPLCNKYIAAPMLKIKEIKEYNDSVGQ